MSTMPFSESVDATGLGMAPARSIADDMDLGPGVQRPKSVTEIDRRLTRWIVFVGDVITSKSKLERPDLKIGGEYLGQFYPTLLRTRGLVRRCQLTPMEIGYDFLSAELVGDNTTGLAFVGSVQHNERNDGNGHRTSQQSLGVVEIFPGDQIKGLLSREHNATNGVKGFVEIEALRGVSVEDVQQSGIQEFLFKGEWRKILSGFAEIPNKISALKIHFEERLGAAEDEVTRKVCLAYIESCDRYRRWGVDYLKTAAQLVRSQFTNGFAHTYPEQAEMLFEQLEVTREDALRLAANTPISQVTSTPTNGDVSDLLHKLVTVQQQLADLQLAKVETPTPDVPVTPQTEPQPGHADEEKPQVIAKVEDEKPRCTAINSTTNEQCSREAVDGTDRCSHPAHSR